MNQYEAMFVFDPTFGSSMENCETEIRRLMERAGAELLFCRKWDERRLAYRIDGRKRGVYVLTYFKAEADKIVGIERDVHLSDDVLRVLALRADYVTPEMMDRAVPSFRESAGPSGGDEAPVAKKAVDDGAGAKEAPAADVDHGAAAEKESPSDIADTDAVASATGRSEGDVESVAGSSEGVAQGEDRTEV